MEATTQIFLRVQVTDDESSVIRGEALVEGYSDRMLIDSFSFAMKARLQSPGPDDEKPINNCKFEHLTVDKTFDRASTRLAGLVKPAKDQKESPLLSEVRITLDQMLVEEGEGYAEGSRKTQNAIMAFHLYKARVVDYKLNASEDKASATLKEVVTFAFQNVSIDYFYKGDKKDMSNSDYRGDISSAGKSDYRDAWVTFDTEYKTQADGED